jgi:hypothetical protein
MGRMACTEPHCLYKGVLYVTVVKSELKGMWKEAVTATTRGNAQSLSEPARRTNTTTSLGSRP